MANEEHLKIIKQGVKVWNAWRRENSTILPDLTGADLVGAHISDADLSDADLTNVNLSEARLRRANLLGSKLFRATLTWARMSEVNLAEADLREANLSHAILRLARINGANLRSADLSWADLSHAELPTANLSLANLNDANLDEANLSEADLSSAIAIRAVLTSAALQGANLNSARLSESNFSEACLSGANLSQANLSSARLTRTDLRNADLSEVNLYMADLTNADLSNADLIEAELDLANLAGANLDGTNFGEALLVGTIFANSDLSCVKGLETVIHRGPSTIGIDTLFKSDGKIPEVFLRGTGVPDDFITFLPSLVGRAIEFYSCFISHSHQDEDFSRRLHSRMRSENLRVWYAPDDMKGGRKLHEEIFQAIQIHDKLLLVLSESSMKSEWVITEIRRARKVEREENRRKLFPIRLVDFTAIEKWECFDADTKKDPAVEVREYYIPDFSNWKNHDAFEAAFGKLLRDLRAEETRPLEESRS